MRQSTKIHSTTRGFHAFYRAALPLSSRTLTYVSRIIRRHRKSIGSRWRRLNPGKQALLVLAYLRKAETFGQLAAGFAIGATTAWRYVEETIALLAARAPKLRTAAREATKAGHAYVVVDGTLIPIDRVAADRPTVRAPASGVWPWIAQLGQGRGRFYSYDFLENLAGCDVHSADRIVPEWQDIVAGDRVRLAPQATLAVAYLERGRSLVLRGGIPLGNTAPPYDFNIGIRARRCAKGDHAAARARKICLHAAWARLLVEPVEAVSFVMSQRMLRGIRDRAEHATGMPLQSPAPAPPPA
jgi:hypothetical protein